MDDASSMLRTQAGFTPLLQASQDGKIGVVKALKEHVKDLDMNQLNTVRGHFSWKTFRDVERGGGEIWSHAIKPFTYNTKRLIVLLDIFPPKI